MAETCPMNAEVLAELSETEKRIVAIMAIAKRINFNGGRMTMPEIAAVAGNTCRLSLSPSDIIKADDQQAWEFFRLVATG